MTADTPQRAIFDESARYHRFLEYRVGGGLGVADAPDVSGASGGFSATDASDVSGRFGATSTPDASSGTGESGATGRLGAAD